MTFYKTPTELILRVGAVRCFLTQQSLWKICTSLLDSPSYKQCAWIQRCVPNTLEEAEEQGNTTLLNVWNPETPIPQVICTDEP